MTRDEIAAVLARRAEGWRERNPAILASAYAETAEVESPLQGPLKGRARIEQAFQKLFVSFPDWTYTPEPALIDGDRAAESFTVTGTHQGELFGIPASGRQFEIHGVIMYKLADGKIVDDRRVYDFTGLLVQLGVLKAKPA